MTLALRYAAHSDVGLGPKNRNEDSGYAGPHLLAVADGMGGAVGGNVASAITIATVRALDTPGHRDPEQVLGQAASDANARIAARIDADPHLEGMGTTLTAVLFDGENAHIAHIGDSRAYLLREGRLRMLTHDHTFVQSLVDEGRITPEEAEHHPHRSLIIRVLEGRQDARPDLFAIELDPGDRLLLCSDGLDNAAVKDDAIADILIRASTPEDAAISLIERALLHGSPDNVTCVVADVVEASQPVSGVPALVGAVNEADPALHYDGPATAEHTMFGGPGVPSQPGPPMLPATQPPNALDEGLQLDEPDLEEELRYAPRPPRRFRWLFRLVGAAVVLGLIGVGARWAFNWTQEQYYVGAYSDDTTGGTPRQPRVAIFRGIAQQVPGIRLSDLYQVEPLELTKLPPYHRERVTNTIAADNLGEAKSIVAMLQDIATKCATPPAPRPAPTPGRTPTQTGPAPTPSLTTSPGRRPGGALAPTASTSADPRATSGTRTVAAAPDLPLECGDDAAPTPDPTGTK
ncbi:PP2C family protein-serine/threonine phosphatase [Actinopolymorpha alba]|uniref:PP2C family protein-serine/threonine phosphatase n=1 Tax=Actinopolymorpha alba TaxID=533267 RepID=UPI00037391D6|nr:PP2C family serine/threonine-protein phosphatase [Actinopolymorpha alba]